VTVEHSGKSVHVELGFRYFFKSSYPYFLALLRILDVEPRWVRGEFTVVDASGRTVVLPPRGPRQLGELLRSPRRLRWLLCLERLRREAGSIVAAEDWSYHAGGSLLRARGYPAGFGPELLFPFVAASWGAPLSVAKDLPAYDVCKVMLHPARNAGFYQFAGRQRRVCPHPRARAGRRPPRARRRRDPPDPHERRLAAPRRPRPRAHLRRRRPRHRILHRRRPAHDNPGGT
jgi:predicted NAD/FAD-binding protein